MWREIDVLQWLGRERQGGEHQQRKRHGLGTPHPSPATRDASDRPGAGYSEERVPGDRLRQVVLRLVAELVRGDHAHFLVAEATVEQRVPEEHFAGGPDPGRVGVGRGCVPVDVLHPHLDIFDALDLRETVNVGGHA